MKYLSLLLIFFMSTTSFAQRYTIQGKVTDTLGTVLPGATVLLLNPNDSSLVNFNISNKEGDFILKNIAKGNYMLKITFVGYQSHVEKLALADSNVLELAVIQMLPYIEKLGEVTVAPEQAPVVMKRDTIEFNAPSFKTQANANVEELLKKLPGVEIDNDGNITAQGEQVQSVTVDGKNFFGRDPKIATRNLPADAVDKVQVFDKKSDQAAFTGIDDGQREKTINLQLKEEKRKAAFGNATAGLGTENRFVAKASINRFNKGEQLSFLGSANNVNDYGFSMDDYMNFTGGSSAMMSGGRVQINVRDDQTNGVPMNFGNRANGLMSTAGAGTNFNHIFSKDTELNGSYFYNFLDHDILKDTYRENFLPQGSYTYSEQSKQNNTNENHRANITLEHAIDSANSLKLTSSFAYNKTETEQYVESQNATQESVENESERHVVNAGDNMNFNSELLLRHRFAKKNRTLSANLNFTLQQTDRDGTLDALTRYISSAEEMETHQDNTQVTSNQRYGAQLSYTEPLGNRKYIEANYSYQANRNDSDKDVYDITNDQQVYNESLSNEYTSNYQYQRGGLNFRLNRRAYSLTAGVSAQHTKLTGDLETVQTTVDKSFQNLLPSAHFNYDFSMTRHLHFDYETSMQEPSIQQLQPIIDNSDPLNISEGNPNLEPAYAHSWRFNYLSFNPISFTSFFIFVDFDYTLNAISNARWVNEDLVTNTRPVNVDHTYNSFVNANFSFPINKIKSRLNVGSSWTNNKSITLLNDQPNGIDQQTLGVNARYEYNYKEILNVSLGGQLSLQNVNYEFDQPDQHYVNQTYTAESNLSFLKNFLLRANLEYLIYKNEGTDFKQNIPLLNLSLSRYFLKNKSGELKLAVNNLLDKALGINQTSSINYTERTTTNSLGRYFMASFTYVINKHLNPTAFRRPPAGMRIIRP